MFKALTKCCTLSKRSDVPQTEAVRFELLKKQTGIICYVQNPLFLYTLLNFFYSIA